MRLVRTSQLPYVVFLGRGDVLDLVMMVLLMIEKGGAAMRTDERTRNKVDTVLRHTSKHSHIEDEASRLST